MCKARVRYSIAVWLMLIPGLLIAQYNNETVTEKSFETSNIFFQSHFLNPFGVESFKNVAVGFIDNPFLNLQQNPANIPQFDSTNTYIYLDFRGDRTRSFLTESYAEPLAYDDLSLTAPSYFDPRWYSSTREEPEPVFSLGLLRNLELSENRKLLIGGTYQLVHREEPFYQVPNWIYYSRFGYDELGGQYADLSNVPITDIGGGSDELFTTGHFYSGFLAANLNDNLSIGMHLNGVNQDLDGLYGNFWKEEYRNNNEWQQFSENQRKREQTYSHWDLAGGLHFKLNETSSAGIKLGYLDGIAEQSFNSNDTSFYSFGEPQVGDNWSLNNYGSNTAQGWERDGNSRYGRLHFATMLNPKNRFSVQYRLQQSNQDLLNSSSIYDSSFYDSRWQNGNEFSEYESRSKLIDNRSGSGERTRTEHLLQAINEWQLSPRTTITGAVTYLRRNTDLNTLETVISDRSSFYRNVQNYSGLDTTTRDRSRFEDKSLEWTYDSDYWSIQIPIVANFKINKRWQWMVGINRILEHWEINEQTLATFKQRIHSENGNTTNEENFAERYINPRERISEQSTDFITSIEAALSDKLSINLLLDPQFSNGYDGTDFRIAQWWLGFKAKL